MQKQKELIEEKRNWETLSDTEKVDYAYNYTLKEVNIGGNIFTTTSTENFIPTGIKLGYNRTKATPEKFSDIKLIELSKDAIAEISNGIAKNIFTSFRNKYGSEKILFNIKKHETTVF